MPSSPSTPRTARTASPSEGEAEGEGEQSPQILTPGKKIKSILAAFDSDSDSDPENREKQKPSSKPRSPTNEPKPTDDIRPGTIGTSNSGHLNNGGDSLDDGEYSDDADTVVPKGRMAARMLDGARTGNERSETAFERVSRQLKANEKDEKEGGQGVHGPSGEEGVEGDDEDAMSSDDGLPSATATSEKGPIKTKDIGTTGDKSSRSPSPPQSPARSSSPLFMPMDTAQDEGEEAQDQERPDGEKESDNEDNDKRRTKTKANPRFLALVAQKRQEREEKERAEEEKRASRIAQMEKFSSEILSDDDGEGDGGGDGDDDDIGDSSRKKPRQRRARPNRKASKKALEEMNRETQRISRNMQLAHEAKTKKKITKESFLARFSIGQSRQEPGPGPGPGPGSDDKGQHRSQDGSSMNGSLQSSEGEAGNGKEKETPQTSPILEPLDKSTARGVASGAPQQRADEPDFEAQMAELPSMEELLDMSEDQLEDKPKNAKPTTTTAQKGKQPQRIEITKDKNPLPRPAANVNVNVHLSRQSVARNQNEDTDSDDDLEVVTSPGKCRRIAAFENLPAKRNQEPSSLVKLRALAHLTSPTRKTQSMTPAELSVSLLQRAKQQAARERQERIQELRDKGIPVETAEERARMEDEVENLVDKARKEADDIARVEKRESKKGGQDVDDEEEEEDADYELSGSEEEDGNRADDDEDENELEEEEEEDQEDRANVNGENKGLIDAETGEDDKDGNSQDEGSEAGLSEDEADMPTSRPKESARGDDHTSAPQTPVRPAANPTTNSAERPQVPPGLGAPDDALSLTQAFAGTLAENQSTNPENSPTTLLPSLPEPEPAPNAGQKPAEPATPVAIKNNQKEESQLPAETETTDILAQDPQYQYYDSRVSESPALQYSQIPEPTQDAGFVLSQFDPSKRFMSTPASTVATDVFAQNHESPIANRKGKQVHRDRAELSDVEEEDGFDVEASAFDVLKKGSKKKPAVQFDKSKSKAKDIVEEAAEESEDEYAGLGGASDESDGEGNEYDEDMINDNSGEMVDEKQLAALNAGHQRATDEKQVEKLMKDITTGALRRRRGGDDDFDLDDSDDERMARRREKQREFARMRKALLADEKVGQLAENPKKAAFFRAIEDRDMDDDVDLDFLNENPDDEAQEPQHEGESSSQNVEAGDGGQQERNATSTSGESSNNKRKRPLEQSTADLANRPPPNLRRTKPSAASKKPTSLAEIRETVSFLTERPEYDSFHETAFMDIDDEEAESEPQANNTDGASAPPPPAPSENNTTRTSKDGFTIPPLPRRTRGPVIDRLALLRQASSNSASTSASANTRPAFFPGNDIDVTANVGFRPPPLLRRAPTAAATTSSSSSSSLSSNSKVPKSSTGPGVAKKGAVNYYTAAREREREREIRVKQQRSGAGSGSANIAALLSRQRAGGLGALGKGGQWE